MPRFCLHEYSNNLKIQICNEKKKKQPSLELTGEFGIHSLPVIMILKIKVTSKEFLTKNLLISRLTHPC